jgi:hypothetical protein
MNDAYSSTTGGLPEAEDGAICSDDAPEDEAVGDVVEETEQGAGAGTGGGRGEAEGEAGGGEKGAGKRGPGK